MEVIQMTVYLRKYLDHKGNTWTGEDTVLAVVWKETEGGTPTWGGFFSLRLYSPCQLGKQEMERKDGEDVCRIYDDNK